MVPHSSEAAPRQSPVAMVSESMIRYRHSVPLYNACFTILCGAALHYIFGAAACVEQRCSTQALEQCRVERLCSTRRFRAGIRGLCGAILLHTSASIPVCVLCGESALHTFASRLPCALCGAIMLHTILGESLASLVWSNDAPHAKPVPRVERQRSTRQNPTLVWRRRSTRRALHDEPELAFAPVWSVSALRAGTRGPYGATTPDQPHFVNAAKPSYCIVQLHNDAAVIGRD